MKFLITMGILPLKKANKIQLTNILLFKDILKKKVQIIQIKEKLKRLFEYIQENKAYYIRFLQTIKRKRWG